jgi:hypothetical protein
MISFLPVIKSIKLEKAKNMKTEKVKVSMKPGAGCFIKKTVYVSDPWCSDKGGIEKILIFFPPL